MKIELWTNGLGLDVTRTGHEVWFKADGNFGVRTFTTDGEAAKFIDIPGDAGYSVAEMIATCKARGTVIV